MRRVVSSKSKSAKSAKSANSNSNSNSESDSRASKTRPALRCSRWDCEVQLFGRVPISFPCFALWHPPRRFFLEYCADACPGEAFEESQWRGMGETLAHILPVANYFCDRCELSIVKNHDQTDREFFDDTVARHVNGHYEAYDPMEIRYVICSDDDKPDDQGNMTCGHCMEPLRLGYNTGIELWVYEECFQVDSGSGTKMIVHQNCNSKTQ